MSLERFSRSALAVTPWKNGGGTTQEVVCFPPGAGLDDFDWRVSIATIAMGGPFSVFPGVDRTIMLLEGDGVRLRAAGFDHALVAPHEPFTFDGETAVECSLRGGISTDFNLMVRRAGGQATLRVISEMAMLERSAHGLLMTLDGQWRVGGGMLTEGQGVWWADEPQTWTVKPASRGARLAVVQWLPADAAPPGEDFQL
ncbi:HutD/Ves family protein [Variovorax sp. ZT4R33]|uniref:HutD/Ves family protein n=1 Tax=Variovorax sp. ZT4R33 TaxID=3443743 RepID=UPI003F48C95A